LSIILSLPHPISASSQVEHNASITPPTIVQVAAKTLPSQIFRRWTHSHEEDRADILVYRPKTTRFHPRAVGKDWNSARTENLLATRLVPRIEA
jgi:hypothetical protein